MMRRQWNEFRQYARNPWFWLTWVITVSVDLIAQNNGFGIFAADSMAIGVAAVVLLIGLLLGIRIKG